jgi:hypothetical protein
LSGTVAAATGSSPAGTTATESTSSEELVVEGRDDVADPEVRDTRTGGDDATGEVPAEADLAGHAEGLPAGLTGEERVDRLDRRGDQLDQHLAGGRRGFGDRDDPDLVVARYRVQRTHVASLA